MEVLIIDDDIQIREGITKGIDWQSIGITKVRNCGNGLEGLEMVEIFKPDIVFVDVRMPELDGLEFLKRAKEKNATLRVVVISGYSDFEYLQKAIRYGAIEYILKPVKVGKLIQLIRKLRKNILLEQNSQQRVDELEELYRKNFIHNVLNGKISDTNIIQEYLGDRIGKDNIKLVICGLIAPDDRDISRSDYEEKHRIIERFFEDEGILCMRGENEKSLILTPTFASAIYTIEQQVRMKSLFTTLKDIFFKNEDMSLGISSEITLDNIIKGYQMAKLCLDSRIYLGRNTISISYSDLPTTDKEKLRRKLEQSQEIIIKAYKVQEREVILGEIGEVKKIIIEYKPAQLLVLENMIIEVCSRINAWSIQNENKMKMFSISELHEEILELLFLDDYIQFFYDLLVKALDKQRETVNQLYSNLIGKSLEYIDRHFTDNITVNLVGEHIGRTPNYFSHLFKKEKGISFVEYIKKKRMEKAQELLKETDLKIYEVASQVGFKDTVYFSQVYKKYYGIAPSEIRRSKL